MKVNHNINLTIITDSDIDIIKEFKDEVVINTIAELRQINSKFVVFNDVIRYLSNSEKERFFTNLEMQDINFINVTSNIEESLFSHKIMIINKGKVAIEGTTLSVLKEEKLLKRLGISLPFCIDLSTQLNYYGLIDSFYLDEEALVNKLW